MTAESTTESAHLKLNNQDKKKKKDKDEQGKEQDVNNKDSDKTTKDVMVFKVHSYVHPRTGQTWKALNTPKEKFLAYLNYYNITAAAASSNNNHQHPFSNIINNYNRKPSPPIVTTKEYKFSHNNKNNNNNGYCEHVRKEWLRVEMRRLWRRQRLLTDRTEFLAIYPSDNNPSSTAEDRGGFSDLLQLYSERLVAALEEELVDMEKKNGIDPTHTDAAKSTRGGAPVLPSSSLSTQSNPLLHWLKEHYGTESTNRLLPENVQQLSEKQQLAQFKHFLEWFRSSFPYYYDRCSNCGASIKEEQAAAPPPPPPAPANCLGEDAGDDCDNDDETVQPQRPQEQTFVGYIYPGETELLGKASRTELYQCHKCHEFTRFPRYNSAWHVLEDRRGRCGEYSMLLFRFLRALGHEARWVVDWADHVWAEVLLTTTTRTTTTREGPNQYPRSRWIHLDPCEAAVDENLIYEGWGKKQTYIMAFYAPLQQQQQHRDEHNNRNDDANFSPPLIEDVTAKYTSDLGTVIQERRDDLPEYVDAAIVKAVEQLRNHTQFFGSK